MPVTSRFRPSFHPSPTYRPKPAPPIPRLGGYGNNIPVGPRGVRHRDGKTYVQLTGDTRLIEVRRDSSGTLREILPDGRFGNEVIQIGNTSYYRRKNNQNAPAPTQDRIKSPDRTRLGFGERIRGKERKPEDTTFAKLSRDVYNDKGSNIDGFARLTPEELRKFGIEPSDLNNPKSGLNAAIYRNAKGEYVVAFAGTANRQDVKSDIKQGLGLSDKQYADAVKLAKKAKKAFGGSLVFTGHSLGGGLASLAALAVDAPAVTFNAAGVHDNTFRRFGLDAGAARKNAGNGLVRSYYVENELLSDVQDKIAPLPDAVGVRIPVPPAKPYSSTTFVAPGESLAQHGSQQVVDAMTESEPKLRVA